MNPQKNPPVRPSIFARARAFLNKPLTQSASALAAALPPPPQSKVGHVPAPALKSAPHTNSRASVTHPMGVSVRTGVTADELLKDFKNAPASQRDEKARGVCVALLASLGANDQRHAMTRFRNERDPERRAELGMAILTTREKPSSVLSSLLENFQCARTESDRAALFAPIQLAAKRAGLLFHP